MAAAVAIGMTAMSATAVADAAPTGAPAYELAGNCYQLDGKGVPSGKYSAKAASLGHFLFYDRGGRVLTVADGAAVPRKDVTPNAIWSANHDGDKYRIKHGSTTRTVALTPTDGCRAFPEAQLNVEGTVDTGLDANGLPRGFTDSHAHLMSEQFLGGGIHCGEPYSPLGITVALKDCPDHGSDGWPALSEHILSKPGPHSSAGWPTFDGWPTYYSLTHEQTYYRWLERAWRGGVSLINNYYVQNRVLCELYPLGDQPCDEMQTVRIQHQRLLAMRDYIDAQAGGPGKGFLKIVTSSQQARDAIAQGKLAVSLGIEISEPFGCREINGAPQCTRRDIDRDMDELKAMGVRQMILTHKFDNALGGARIDSDFVGLAVDVGQVIASGKPWATEPCRTDQRDNVAPGDAPGRCNVKGLTPLGEYAVNAAIKRNLIIDVDHLSVKTASKVLDIVGARKYPGVVTSHSWTDPGNYKRVLSTGGTIGLYASGAERLADDPESESFIDQWHKARAANGGQPLGIAYGADTGGLGPQAPPRVIGAKTKPVRYPFRSANGALLNKQVSGTKAFDVNVDGTAHIGLIPDWIESLRIAAGPEGDALVSDMYHAAGARVAMWQATEAYGR